MNAPHFVPTETVAQTAAWDLALTEHAAELEQLGDAAELDLAALPDDADDATW